MGLIIDTSVIIAAEKGRIDFSRVENYGEAYMSAITVTELLVGVERADSEERRIKRSAFVEQIIASITAIPFGREEARVYARILRNLFSEKLTIGTHDMIIAATAIANDCTVITLNTKDFEKIKGLKVMKA